MAFGAEFSIEDSDGKARAGRLNVNGVEIATPVFMPVGTNASVKAVSPSQVEECGAKIILANNYHLTLRPGVEVVEKAGGVKEFSGWRYAMLTDSGGYQVFSLAKMNKISDEGVEFNSHIDGKKFFFTPELAIENQHKIGADLIMAWDECAPHDADYSYVKKAAERTSAWAKQCLDFHKSSGRDDRQFLGAIVQGGLHKDLRLQSAKELIEMDFPFYAIGGLSVGEGGEMMEEVLSYCAPALPSDKARYLMGVGEPSDILNAVSHGVDMFDCVMPTRNARNGELFTFDGPLRIRNSDYINQHETIEEGCCCYTCRNFSRAYLRHLNNAKEMLYSSLATIHNLSFMMRFMDKIRSSIIDKRFADFKKSFIENYYVKR